MGVAVHSDKLRELVDETAEVEQVATGCIFTEGPIWMPDGSLHFSDMPGDKRRRWHPRGRHRPARPEQQVQRDDARQRRQPDRLRARHELGRPRVARRHRETLATHYGGKELNSPNDVIVARDGSIIFTDPTYGRMPGFGLEREQDLDFQGVYRLPPDGASPSSWSTTSASRTASASRPTSRCSTSTTPTARTSASSTSARALLSNGRVFAEGIGDGDLAKGGLVDGMKLDERGNVYVTGPDGVWVFDAAGEHLGTIEVPESVGNVNWGEDDWSSLFIAASSSIYRVRMKVGGNRLGYMC